MFIRIHLAIWALQRALLRQPLGQYMGQPMRPPQPDRLQIKALLAQYRLMSWPMSYS